MKNTIKTAPRGDRGRMVQRRISNMRNVRNDAR